MSQYSLKTFREPTLPRLRPWTSDLIAMPRDNVFVGGLFPQSTITIDVPSGDDLQASITVTHGWVHGVAWNTHFTLPRFGIRLHEDDNRPFASYEVAESLNVTPGDVEQYRRAHAFGGLMALWEESILQERVRLLRLRRRRPALVVGEVADSAAPGWLETDHGRYVVQPRDVIVRELDGLAVRPMSPLAMRYEFEGLWDPGQSLIVRYDSPV